MKAPFKIAIIYLICGLLWIFLSDTLLYHLVNYDKEQFAKIQTVKGFFYIGLTAILLYFLVNHFYKRLANKLDTLKLFNIALEESEQRYSDLFRLSPLPMWVYDNNNLRFLAVNDAAVKQYGYTREEFLAMTIKDIRREEELPQLMNTMLESRNDGQFAFRGVFRHKKKNEDIVTVEIRSNGLQYKGVKSRVVLVNDITERMKYIAAIEQQNEKLQEIAWMQSHVVRAPLARMMGFIHLLEDCKIANEEKELVMKNILVSATELDKVIHEISEKTREVT